MENKLLAIKGHPTRGKEVIEILEMLGGKTYGKLLGIELFSCYYINLSGIICFKSFNLSVDKNT